MKTENYFLIKYRSEEERLAFSDLVLKIVKDFEIKDFHIEEREAYMQPRILYNMHTLITSIDEPYEKLKAEFIKYF